MSKLPTTADGHLLYPGMPVYICVPFSINKYYKETVHSFEIDDESGGCFVSMKGRRWFNEDCGHWDEGNIEHVSKVFFEKEKCLQEYKRKENSVGLKTKKDA